MFLPTNAAWSAALEGYKKTKSSGALYEALDAIASDKIQKAAIKGKKTGSKALADLVNKAKSCGTSTSHPISEAARTAMLNLMSFHTAPSKVQIMTLNAACNPTGTTIKTAFNDNNLNFKCNASNYGIISGADPLAAGSPGTSSAVAAVDEPQKDYYYINAVVFPSNIASLPGAVATVSRVVTALLVVGASLLCAL
ncbi:hypothetical protein CLOP_g7826 [Closterium sp. NIES-67]|nr:hypothetical protein CLOP_g7826 [Closterium sp. NIES-67]